MRASELSFLARTECRRTQGQVLILGWQGIEVMILNDTIEDSLGRTPVGTAEQRLGLAQLLLERRDMSAARVRDA